MFDGRASVAFWEKESRSLNELSIDTKRQICEDVSSDYSFRQQGEHPDEGCVSCLSRFVHRFDYPTQTIRVSYLLDRGQIRNENVFVCLIRQGLWNNTKIYISEEYNLTPDTTDNYIVGRFVFRKLWSSENMEPYKLVELPAATFTSPDLDIEYLYLKRRETYSSCKKREDDALCRLEEEDRVRICVAVLNSKYFENKIIFSHTNKVLGSCRLQPVSFQTEYGKAAALKRKFREWMLSCESRPKENESKIDYLISHAYQTNQIFVYFRDNKTGNVFPENLTTNIRLIFHLFRTTYRHSSEVEHDIDEESEVDKN